MSWINWEISKIVKKGNYLYAVVKNHPKASKFGYVLLHRIIMENHLQRELASDEIVHHKDENKFNNSIENLEVMLKKEHNRYHTQKRYGNGDNQKINNNEVVETECSFCKKLFEITIKKLNKKQKNNKNIFCSKRCNALANNKFNNTINKKIFLNKYGRRIYGKLKEMICPMCNGKFLISECSFRAKTKKGQKNFYCSKKCKDLSEKKWERNSKG